MTLQELFGIELPIIQAPMAGAQNSAMTLAVSNAGGLGSLPAAMLSPEKLREELSAIKAQTDKPYNVNFFCRTLPSVRAQATGIEAQPKDVRFHRYLPPPVTPIDPQQDAEWRKALLPYYEEFGVDPNAAVDVPPRNPFSAAMAEVLEEFRPPIVSFHFGLPEPELLARVKATGAKILSSATTIEEAMSLQKQGVDAIIAQGLEAGGHRGHFNSHDLTWQMGTFSLVPQIVKAVDIPVIAAGGIADSNGVAAALALGASGVQIGTAYLLCPESTISPLHRKLLAAGEPAWFTALTNLFTGWPARGIINRLMRELGPMSELAPDFPHAASAIAPLRAKAEAEGDAGFSPLWCGQNATGCKEIPAAQLTRELAP